MLIDSVGWNTVLTSIVCSKKGESVPPIARYLYAVLN